MITPQQKAAQNAVVDGSRRFNRKNSTAIVQMAEFDESKVNRGGKGTREGGKFVSKGGGDKSLELPKNPKKLTIQQAEAALQKQGLQLGMAPFDLKRKMSMFTITDADGNKRTITGDEVSEMIFGTKKTKA